MSNPSKKKGTAAEVLVRDAARLRGLPAERIPQEGRNDRGDVHLAHGRVVVEVKAGDQAHDASMNLIISDWYSEATTEASRVAACDMAVLVVKRKGKARAGDWRAFVSLADYAHVMGRGEPYPLWAADHRVVEMPLACLLDDLAAVL